MAIIDEIESTVIPHIEKCRLDQPVGVTTESLSPRLKEFFENEPVIAKWLKHCCPTDKDAFRLGVDCDPLTLDGLNFEYSETEQGEDMIDGRLFVFAIDGSGCGFVLSLESGRVYHMLNSWGGNTDVGFEEAINDQWPTISAFLAQLVAT